MRKTGIATLVLAAAIAFGVAGNVSAAGGDESPPPGALALTPAAPAATKVKTPEKTTKFYFTPVDNDSSATVLNVTNTTDVDHVVYLRGYSQNGNLSYSANITMPARQLTRIVTDSIKSGPPPSWDSQYANILVTNFTDFTYWAFIAMPKGVVIDGYTLFNPGTGVVDPRADQGGIPLRFSNDGKFSRVLPVN